MEIKRKQVTVEVAKVYEREEKRVKADEEVEGESQKMVER